MSIVRSEILAVFCVRLPQWRWFDSKSSVSSQLQFTLSISNTQDWNCGKFRDWTRWNRGKVVGFQTEAGNWVSISITSIPGKVVSCLLWILFFLDGHVTLVNVILTGISVGHTRKYSWPLDSMGVRGADFLHSWKSVSNFDSPNTELLIACYWPEALKQSINTFCMLYIYIYYMLYYYNKVS